jgi:fructose-specific phosphotransferase system IIA component
MHIDEVLDQDTMNLNLEAETKKEVIEKLADMLCAADRLTEKEQFVEGVLEREKTESTDFGIGIAIPHAMSASVKRASVAVGRLKKPINWNGSSGNSETPVQVVFLLASSPEDKGRSHMEIISKIAALLIEDDFVKMLLTTDSESALLDAVNTYLGEK